MKQELINEKWESNFIFEGTFIIVYDYLVKGEKYSFDVTGGKDYNQKLFDKNPRLKEIAKASIEVQKEILQEFTQLPNCVWDDCEVTGCEVIKKHIALGNIRVDEDFELDLNNDFFELGDNLYVDLIVEDIFYKDLCQHYINNNPDWKDHFRLHKQHEIEHNEVLDDINRRQGEVMNILAQHGTDIFGSNL